MKFPGFIGPSYSHDSLAFDAQRALNLFPEASESKTSKNVGLLRGRPGLGLWATLTQTPIRALWAGEGRLFVVAGSKLYELNSSGTPINGLGGNLYRGDVGDDAAHSPAEIYPNGSQLFVISAGRAYCDNGAGPVAAAFPALAGVVNTAGTAVTWVSGNTFDVLGMPGFAITINSVGYTVSTVAADGKSLVLTGSAGTQSAVNYAATPQVTARTGAFLDGYFFAARPDSKQVNFSALLDGTTWDPLDSFSKEGYPDSTAAIMADHEELWLFGSHFSTEVWRNEGDKDNPFQRDPGAFIHQANVAPWSRVSLAGSVFWLGGDTRGKTVAYKARGFMPQRVSTHAIEKAWRGYSAVSDCQAYAYVEDGHEWWVLNFPTGNATWVYDATLDLWHEWSYNGANRHRGRCHCYVFGKHLVGDHTLGKIYEQSFAYQVDDGTAITYQRTCPYVAEENKRVFFGRFTLDMETGVGGSGPDPQMTLDWSNNQGASYINAAAKGAGISGDNTPRVYWNRLGSARRRVFRVTSTAAVKQAWIDAYLELEPGKS